MATEILVLLIGHDGPDSPAVALARNRAELLEQVKVAVWGEPHPADTTNDAGDDMAEGMTDTLLETGVMTFEGDPPLRLVRIPLDSRIEAVAKVIYEQWRGHQGYPSWVPWVERGNSKMQDWARKMARDALDGDGVPGTTNDQQEADRG